VLKLIVRVTALALLLVSVVLFPLVETGLAVPNLCQDFSTSSKMEISGYLDIELTYKVDVNLGGESDTPHICHFEGSFNDNQGNSGRYMYLQWVSDYHGASLYLKYDSTGDTVFYWSINQMGFQLYKVTADGELLCLDNECLEASIKLSN